jgi:NAD(P)-dependent dehydrogenase (short-subunit alcohol dehydrogenase family)
MIADFHGKAVLVTGGTMGVGLSTALAFAERGASCTLTYRFGTADEEAVRQRFAQRGAAEPWIVQADVAQAEDLRELLLGLRQRCAAVEVFISNASAAVLVQNFGDYTERGLDKSIHYGAWPLVSYLMAIKEVFGRYPRYVIGMSSTGPDHFAAGYDFVAASKSVMETLCRYLTYRLRDEDVRINVLRSRAIRTASFEATFGAELTRFAGRYVPESYYMAPEEVAEAALALCSGLLDAVRGQVITVDRGTTFFDNVLRLYTEREQLGL